MSLPQQPGDEVVSYQKLRTFIGLIGIGLPVAAVLGCFIKGDGIYAIQTSISHYYYTKMHIVFVGILCVLGGFLINYKGKDNWESRLSNFAGVCAFGIATCPTRIKFFLPTANNDAANQYLMVFKPISLRMNSVHFAFAALLFTCFVLFCLVFFQTPDEPPANNDEFIKLKRRQRFYKICGWGIAVSIASIALCNFVLDKYFSGWFLTFSTIIFETTALWFFGSTWLLKGSKYWSKYPLLRPLLKYYR